MHVGSFDRLLTAPLPATVSFSMGGTGVAVAVGVGGTYTRKSARIV